MAQIKNELNRPDEALADIRQARRIFEEVNSKRNLALCTKAEGDVRRRLAYRYRPDLPRSLREFDRTIERYKDALALFDSAEIGELLRRIEVRQALGCAHRSRGKVLYEARRNHRADKSQLDTTPDHGPDMEAAFSYLQEALELASGDDPTPIVSDILEDIAVIYVNQDDFATASEWLERARAEIPPSFRIVEGEGLHRNEETVEQLVYWLRLGQIEFQYALSSIVTDKWLEGCTRLLQAYACIQYFSTQAPQLESLRSVGRYALASYVADTIKLEELRAETHWAAQKLHLEDAFEEVEQIFDHAIEDVDLF
jgi:tetratricopeptide (TPR) repeat protein